MNALNFRQIAVAVVLVLGALAVASPHFTRVVSMQGMMGGETMSVGMGMRNAMSHDMRTTCLRSGAMRDAN